MPSKNSIERIIAERDIGDVAEGEPHIQELFLAGTPALANATPEHLADELGCIKEAISVLSKREEFLKTALKTRMIQHDDRSIVGEWFTAGLATQGRHSLDTEKVKEILTEEQLIECTRFTEYDVLRVIRK